jgi:hypothetical protein
VQLINVNTIKPQFFQALFYGLAQMGRRRIVSPLVGSWTFHPPLVAITRPAGYGYKASATPGGSKIEGMRKPSQNCRLRGPHTMRRECICDDLDGF